jgi:tRNA1(Val) A37 N6-methylase TrmN6
VTDVTEDGFLDGRITAAQPRRGFRAGHDTVLLAAAAPVKAGEHALELGSGAGIASLCLAARVAGCHVTGIEIDPDLVALANANAARNGMDERVRFVVGDALSFSPSAEGKEIHLFDHVMLNPPFHDARGQVSPSAQRDRARRGEVAAWMQRALDLTRAGGTTTVILRADRLSEVDALASGLRASVMLLLPRADKSAKRVIVQVHKDVRGSRALAWLILHEDDGSPTPAADAILRGAQPLAMP